MTTQAADPRTFGKYHLVATLADGAMGLVYKASDPANGAIVAIKVGSAALARDKVLLKRFEQEFHCTSNLKHPNIVRALEFGWENSRPYIVMELVDGEDLGTRIQRQGRLSEAAAVSFITQVAQGLHEAHKNGIIHRDIKPDNILLCGDGQAKLADLGLSKNLETNMELTCDNGSLGTPTFIAPEQFGDAKHSGVRCDIYSLGATLYMALTGQVPFAGSFLTTILKQKLANNIAALAAPAVPSLSEHVDRSVRRALAGGPRSSCFASCPEFVAAFKGDDRCSVPPAARPAEKPGAQAEGQNRAACEGTANRRALRVRPADRVYRQSLCASQFDLSLNTLGFPSL